MQFSRKRYNLHFAYKRQATKTRARSAPEVPSTSSLVPHAALAGVFDRNSSLHKRQTADGGQLRVPPVACTRVAMVTCICPGIRGATCWSRYWRRWDIRWPGPPSGSYNRSGDNDHDTVASFCHVCGAHWELTRILPYIHNKILCPKGTICSPRRRNTMALQRPPSTRILSLLYFECKL